MAEKIIGNYTSGIIKGLIEKSKAISSLKHKPIQGKLKELFITEVLNPYCPVNLGIGSGIVINQESIQSNETDIIIYDKRILPPFIYKNVGIYPAESVIATIEVKSIMNRREISQAEKKSEYLLNSVYDTSIDVYEEYKDMKPLCGIIGFDGHYINMSKINIGGRWLDDNINNVEFCCLIGKYCWIKMRRNNDYRWTIQRGDDKYDETKRFISVLFDNIRRISGIRYFKSIGKHRDWFSIYTRK